jgi:hypothetical protein
MTAQKEIRQEFYSESARKEQYLSSIEHERIAEFTDKLNRLQNALQEPKSSKLLRETRNDCRQLREIVVQCMSETKGDPLSCHDEVNRYHECALKNAKKE